MIELKPCPFCGAKINSYSAEYIGVCCKRLVVACRACGAEFDIQAPSNMYSNNRVEYWGDDAIARWNRRADE